MLKCITRARYESPQSIGNAGAIENTAKASPKTRNPSSSSLETFLSSIVTPFWHPFQQLSRLHVESAGLHRQTIASTWSPPPPISPRTCPPFPAATSTTNCGETDCIPVYNRYSVPKASRSRHKIALAASSTSSSVFIAPQRPVLSIASSDIPSRSRSLGRGNLTRPEILCRPSFLPLPVDY